MRVDGGPPAATTSTRPERSQNGVPSLITLTMERPASSNDLQVSHEKAAAWIGERFLARVDQSWTESAQEPTGPPKALLVTSKRRQLGSEKNLSCTS